MTKKRPDKLKDAFEGIGIGVVVAVMLIGILTIVRWIVAPRQEPAKQSVQEKQVASKPAVQTVTRQVTATPRKPSYITFCARKPTLEEWKRDLEIKVDRAAIGNATRRFQGRWRMENWHGVRGAVFEFAALDFNKGVGLVCVKDAYGKVVLKGIFAFINHKIGALKANDEGVLLLRVVPANPAYTQYTLSSVVNQEVVSCKLNRLP